jgi:hypothetical protein
MLLLVVLRKSACGLDRPTLGLGPSSAHMIGDGDRISDRASPPPPPDTFSLTSLSLV